MSCMLLIGIIFSVLPRIIVSGPSSTATPCIVTLDVCHVSMEGLQTSIDAPFIHESAFPFALVHLVLDYTALNVIPILLFVISQDYPPPESVR